jgi:glycosyltransferase involved in cell wall biosynthesis
MAQIEVVPNGVDLDYWSPSPGAPAPHTLLFPAALNWPPNLAAAECLLDEILPRVRQRLPQARLVIAGRLPPAPLVARCAHDPSVSLHANPADMRPHFARAALVVVPLPAASGTRLKILQALAAGRPVVSTPAGALGLDLASGRDLCVAELVEPFAAEVVRLLEDEPARATLARAGRAAVQAHAWPRALAALDVIYPSGE